MSDRTITVLTTTIVFLSLFAALTGGCSGDSPGASGTDAELTGSGRGAPAVTGGDPVAPTGGVRGGTDPLNILSPQLSDAGAAAVSGADAGAAVSGTDAGVTMSGGTDARGGTDASAPTIATPDASSTSPASSSDAGSDAVVNACNRNSNGPCLATTPWHIPNSSTVINGTCYNGVCCLGCWDPVASVCHQFDDYTCGLGGNRCAARCLPK